MAAQKKGTKSKKIIVSGVKTKKKITSKGKSTKATPFSNVIRRNIKKSKVKIPLKKRIFTEKNLRRLIFFGVLITSAVWIFWGVPLPTQLTSQQVPVSTKLFDRNGKLLYEIYAEKRRNPVDIDELPDYVWQATIAIEDKDFYKHYGISIPGMTRAAYKIVSGKRLEGGSTLTQQLVKNALLTPDRTIKRKIRELGLTFVVESIYTKNQILSLYLNQIPYGSTAYGIGAASELYLGKPAQDLTLAEAALLAGLPQAPSRYSPFGARPELARERQATVLRRMVEDGYISQEDADAAKNEELSFADPAPLKAPHFSLWVKELLAEKYGESMVERGGLRVTTTLDLDLQEHAEKAVSEELEDLSRNNVKNAAALVTKPATGEILVMVGSKDYFAEDEDGKVNVLFAERQPGSSIKPLNYALGFEDEKITASTPLADVPTCFASAGSGSYCPKNYDGNFHGAVQPRFALGNSYNIPAVRVLALNGIENFVEFATRLGITTWKDPSNYGLSLTLGGGEVRAIDMAVAYGVFANGGIRQNLQPLLKIEDWEGNVLEEVDAEDIKLTGDRVLSAETSYILSHILLDNNARADAFGIRSELVVTGHPEVSVKTGTTNDVRDNWTIGYTSNAVILSWVGNNDNSKMTGAVSGVSGASPIWNSITENILNAVEEKDEDGNSVHAWPLEPGDIVGAQVCWTTGALPQGSESVSPGCPTRFEYFKVDTIPQTAP